MHAYLSRGALLWPPYFHCSVLSPREDKEGPDWHWAMAAWHRKAFGHVHAAFEIAYGAA